MHQWVSLYCLLKGQKWTGQGLSTNRSQAELH